MSSDVPEFSPSDSDDDSTFALNEGRVCTGSGFDGPATGVAWVLSSSGTSSSSFPGVYSPSKNQSGARCPPSTCLQRERFSSKYSSSLL